MLQYYTPSLTQYKRLATQEVQIGSIRLGAHQPIRVQTMTTTDTMDTAATVAQSIRCIEAGAELIRITAPSKKEAENLLEIKKLLRAAGFDTPLVADIHFTPNAAEIAARIVEKVRINPGNYVDKKKFDVLNYTDAAYQAEIERIRERFLPLVKICKTHGTAMRIGTNHGSLSDRIMSRYGDSAMGMVESALEFLRIARDENYHQIVLSMKSSNPIVMVQAYRLLVQKMEEEFKMCYPLHLGVTEAGDGEDGRIKSAVGIGTLLEEGIGDTIRVSLTEDPEFEIPVCKDLIAKYSSQHTSTHLLPTIPKLPYNPFSYQKRKSIGIKNIGAKKVPVVIADISNQEALSAAYLDRVGYSYDAVSDKWNIKDQAADYIYVGKTLPQFALPGTLSVIQDAAYFDTTTSNDQVYPMFTLEQYLNAKSKHTQLNFVKIDAALDSSDLETFFEKIDATVVCCIYAQVANAMQCMRAMAIKMMENNISNPIVLMGISDTTTPDQHLVKWAVDTGAILLEGIGDGLCLSFSSSAKLENVLTQGRTYLPVKDACQFANNTAFSILQATRTRISKTEYISCPSCGRTLFDLQETTAKIREATHHLKGVKIAIMGCIVNGPGEMADADFGYVGSGPGKISLYKNKEVVKKNIPSEIAVEELIQLLKDNNAWVEPKE